jgi:uncharacterized protein (TIGR03435 family)
MAVVFYIRKRLGFASLAVTASLIAQQSASLASPTFDVVSIHAVPPNAPLVMRDQDFTPILPGGRYIDDRTSLDSLICFAYHCRYPDRQLIGLPKWAKSQIFAIAAKPAEDFPRLPPNENREQVRLMLRAMLADRFQLRLHTETRQ